LRNLWNQWHQPIQGNWWPEPNLRCQRRHLFQSANPGQRSRIARPLPKRATRHLPRRMRLQPCGHGHSITVPNQFVNHNQSHESEHADDLLKKRSPAFIFAPRSQYRTPTKKRHGQFAAHSYSQKMIQIAKTTIPAPIPPAQETKPHNDRSPGSQRHTSQTPHAHPETPSRADPSHYGA